MSRKTDSLYSGFRIGQINRRPSRGFVRAAFEWTAVTLVVGVGTLVVLTFVA